MKISLAVLLVALALAASSQSDCLMNQNSLWIQNDQSAFVDCSGAEFGSSLSWWAVSDPCQNGPSSSITSLQCSGGSCSVESDVYGRADTSSCHVCCTNGATFTPEAIISCTAINVCPTVNVEVPRLAKTGGRVEVLTYVLTKPPPPSGTVTVTAKTAANSTNLTVEGDGTMYPDPFAPNSYVFTHVVELPERKASTDDRVLCTIDLSAIPHGDSCTSVSTVVRSTNLLEVDVTSTATTTTGVPAAKDTTSSGVAPSDDGLASEPSGGLNIVSLGIGIGIGVACTLLVVGVVAVVITLATCSKCACSYRKKSSMESRSHHNSSNGGERPLLTSNGTPATTPSSDVQRSLGQTSDSTPASTPTDPNELLLTTQQSQTSDASPYEEVAGMKHSNFQSAIILDRQRVAANVPPMGSGAPPPQEPAPPPPVPPLPSFRPNPPRIEQAVLHSSAPGYMKQPDMAIYLSNNRNNGDSLV